MREAASRGFWVASKTPYGFRRVMVQDGAKKRPKLEPDEVVSPVVRRIFGLADKGRGMLDIARTLNDEGIASATGKLWSKNAVHFILRNEVYTGTLVWGTAARDEADPVRVEKGVSRHRLQGTVPPGERCDALPGAEGHPPPQGGQPLHAQWTGQVLQVQEGSLGPGLKERQVPLLRLPVPDEEG